MKALVLGGSGVVGARLLARLMRSGDCLSLSAVVFSPSSQVAVERLGVECHLADVREKVAKKALFCLFF
jgi:uncharacterized protein YbjT (DUF2867 family)